MTAMIYQAEQSDDFILQELQKCAKLKIKSISLVQKNSFLLCHMNIDKNPYIVKFLLIPLHRMQHTKNVLSIFSSYFKIMQQFKYTFNSIHLFCSQRTVVK